LTPPTDLVSLNLRVESVPDPDLSVPLVFIPTFT